MRAGGDPAGAAWRLVLDTATRHSTVGLGEGRALDAADVRDVGQAHGSALLEQVKGVLLARGIGLTAITALGVGTGPGSFTGLRIGMATAKTLAWSLGLPLVGLSTVAGLRRAAAEAAGIEPARLAVVLPAGARDHYLALPGEPPLLVPPGQRIDAQLGGCQVLAVDVSPERCRDLGPSVEAADAALCRAAVDGFAAALLALLEERLRAGPPDDTAGLVPSYVALPRGLAAGAQGMTWSPDPR